MLFLQSLQTRVEVLRDIERLTRITALLTEGDRWARTREHTPEPFPPDEPLLPHLATVYPDLAEQGRSRRKLMALHGVGIHSAEGLMLKQELAELGMEREEYNDLIRRFANAVRRKVVVSRGTEACPVCGQYVVNPNSRSPIRWFARGMINIGRTAVFLFELALVGAMVFMALGALRQLVRFIAAPE